MAKFKVEITSTYTYIINTWLYPGNHTPEECLKWDLASKRDYYMRSDPDDIDRHITGKIIEEVV